MTGVDTSEISKINSLQKNQNVQVKKGMRPDGTSFVFDPRNFKITMLDGRELNMIELEKKTLKLVKGFIIFLVL